MNAVRIKIQLRRLNFVDLNVIRCMLLGRHWSLQPGPVCTFGKLRRTGAEQFGQFQKGQLDLISLQFSLTFCVASVQLIIDDMELDPPHLFLHWTIKYSRPARCTAVILSTRFRIEVTGQRSQVLARIIQVFVFSFTLRWLFKS
jgi:hypothetical protein